MLVYAALSPHPPLLIPEIGGTNLGKVEKIVDSMKKIADDIKGADPETIVFFTPHGNVFSDCLSALSMPELKGDFAAFGCRNVNFKVENDLTLLKKVAVQAKDEGIDFILIDEETAARNRLNARLDHGILVPMYYLKKAGLDDVAILAISIGYLPFLKLYKFGKIVEKAAADLGRRVAIVASGDMSHRLKEEGPYSYHPDGPEFDRMIKEHMEKGEVEALLKIPNDIRENAGECGYRSLVMMLGSLDGRDFQIKHLEYAGPFGVGYLTAGLLPGNQGISYLNKMENDEKKKMGEIRKNESLPVRWARMVLESYITEQKIPELPAEMKTLEKQKAAAFVSLKKYGSLRGCIGTILPAHENLALEIAYNAISAGTRDPRFLPVEKEELKDLVYSVDVLEKPEPCTKDDLDPKNYGVIVSKGSRRGLLLPDLEGVDTVEEQLSIALQKAGIRPDEDYQIERFKVTRYT
ncbi:AmmeMemoRadiSam system protein A [Thermosyntropha sp.]|uniref:AmmeMemoRadiSam system protein A n=1 Tax=Thermosyntropha sp. TaxID=2740820 RepID=UPI0025CD9B51|nr:AmmeMemoRadiSam system protein A [Thermosyntropha sp.]MBO8158077.1 AmmeMemoRadiSam system protein A [Thermosyntropha sp.]